MLYFLFFVLNKNYLWAEILKTRANIVNRKYHFLVKRCIFDFFHILNMEIKNFVSKSCAVSSWLNFSHVRYYSVKKMCFWLLHILKVQKKILASKNVAIKSWLNFSHALYYNVKPMYFWLLHILNMDSKNLAWKASVSGEGRLGRDSVFHLYCKLNLNNGLRITARVSLSI